MAAATSTSVLGASLQPDVGLVFDSSIGLSMVSVGNGGGAGRHMLDLQDMATVTSNLGTILEPDVS